MSHMSKRVLFIYCSDYQKSPKAKDNVKSKFPTTERCAESSVHFAWGNGVVHGYSLSLSKWPHQGHLNYSQSVSFRTSLSKYLWLMWAATTQRYDMSHK